MNLSVLPLHRFVYFGEVLVGNVMGKSRRRGKQGHIETEFKIIFVELIEGLR